MRNYKNIEELLKELENIKAIPKESKEDVETNKLAENGSEYLMSHNWCDSIEDGWLAVSWGYILCVFLFKIKSSVPEVDDYIWIVNGDIPTAYIDIESAKNPQEVLESYIFLMNDWIEEVELGNSTEDCYPIEVPPTKEFATNLKSRINFIEKEISKW